DGVGRGRKRPARCGTGSHLERVRRRSRSTIEKRGGVCRTVDVVFDCRIYRHHFHWNAPAYFLFATIHQVTVMKINTSIHHRINQRARRGFTLVELLLVLVILGTLAAIVLPRFTGTTEKARISQATTQISTFKTALNGYEIAVGSYPKGTAGLVDLIQKPRDAQGWSGPYLDTDAIPKDPWNNDYVYTCP